MLNIKAYDGFDKNRYKQVYESQINFICGNDKNLKNRLKKEFENKIEIISISKEENDIVSYNQPSLILTYYDFDKIKKNKCYLKKNRIYIIDYENNEDFVSFNMFHETLHAICSVIPFLIKNNVTYEEKDNIINFNFLGSIGTIKNEINYKTGLIMQETLTDLLSFVSYSNNTNFINRINPNTILKDNIDVMNIIPSHYLLFSPFVRLAVAAFSNNPYVDYNEILENNDSVVFNKCKMNNGEILYSNDLLYGYVSNILHTKKVFDDIEGNDSFECMLGNLDEAYFKIYLDLVENEDFNDKMNFDNDNINNYLTLLTNFVFNKERVYLEKGLFNKKEAKDYLKNYIYLLNDICKTYNFNSISKNILCYRYKLS